MLSVNAKSFLEDLKAAVLLGCELESGDSESSSDTTLSKRLSVTQLDQLSNVETASWPQRMTVALGVFRQTGTMPIVFEALSVRLDSDRWVSRVLRKTWWYLLLVIATMVLGMFSVFYFANNDFQNFSADLKLSTTGDQATAVELMAWFPTAMICGIVIGLLLLGWLLLGGSRRLTMRLGGRKILQIQQTATLLKILEQVNPAGNNKGDSIELACDAVAAGPKIRSQVHAALDDARSNVGLSAWAESLAKDARKRMTVIELWLPLMIVTLIGGGLAVFYCLLIYRPIISMLLEFASSARDV